MFNRAYFYPILITFFGGIFALPLIKRRLLVPMVIVIGYGAASLYAMIAPGREYFHYPRIFVLAASVTVGALVSIYYVKAMDAGRRRTATAIALLFALITLTPQLYFRLKERGPFRGTYRTEHNCMISAVGRLVLQNAMPNDAMALWGWEPKLYVQTQLRQATREAQTQHQIEPSVLQTYFRDRYMSDFMKSRPSVFIDTVGGGNFAYEDRALQGHEILPALRDLIGNHYRLVGDIEGVRVYIRNN